jgi:hypothetical protein
VIAQAAGLALLAALSPTALLITAVYLGSARPRLTGMFYLAGAVLMSLVMGVVVLVVLRNTGLNQPREHTPRYGLRLALGVLLIAVALVVVRRRSRSPDPAKADRGLVSRLVANPSPVTAFVAGVIIFAPGLSFIAALQVIATAQASIGLTAVAIVVVVIINVLLVWVPLVLHLLAPRLVMHRLTAFNGWLRAHGQQILIGVFLIVGVIMVINGTRGLLAG